MTDNSKFKRDLPYIKYDRCKSFFMILTDILRKNENYQLQISSNKNSIKCSTYLVPHGTKSQITYYSKPDKSFRFSGHWNWYVPHNLCYNEHYIQYIRLMHGQEFRFSVYICYKELAANN